MNVNEALRLIAGIVIIVSVALTLTVSVYWIGLTVFVGLNLFQSAFTKWCPMMTILRRAGLSG